VLRDEAHDLGVVSGEDFCDDHQLEITDRPPLFLDPDDVSESAFAAVLRKVVRHLAMSQTGFDAKPLEKGAKNILRASGVSAAHAQTSPMYRANPKP
jgi:hypothetical protein